MAPSTSFLSPVTVQRRGVRFHSLKPRVCSVQMAPIMGNYNYSQDLAFKPAQPMFRCLEAPLEEENYEKELDPITDENLDEWIKESVSEIVRNIGEAPFLVRIFSRNEENRVRLEREAATPEMWPGIKKKWTHQPDGIILVDQLKDDPDSESDGMYDDRHGDDRGQSNKSWGLVVQGRGTECVACYILNTCRVGSPAGFCTHFCLARAQCFGDSFESQLRNAWLNRRNSR